MAMVRQFDEDAVLQKVLEVFWAKGWQATSMADLATAANVQRGSLYHAYDSKEHLLELAFERYATQVLAESRAALDAPSARQALRRFFEVSIASMTADSPPRGCFTTKTIVESDALGEEMRTRVRAFLDQMEQLMVESLSREDVRSSLSETPKKTAQVIMAFSRGLAVMERLHHDPDRLQTLGDSVVSLLVKPRAAA